MKEEIALALSGGGYRAAMFHLGTLSYLNHLNLTDDRSFLDIVNTISTVSGGTITGLWYMVSYCHDRNIDESFAELYKKLVEFDLPTNILNAITDTGNKNTSLIKEMVKIYDEVFFHGETFSLILDNIDSGHIHHFSANGTDFSNGYAFRFQASREIVNIDPKFKRGIIGNKDNILPWNIAKQVNLSEILAVSSCFPGGFEPMNYPQDFTFSSKEENLGYTKDLEPYQLMDGGIVDNQGIEPLLLANQQMIYDDLRSKDDQDFKCHDLLIISDVTNPYSKPTKEINTGKASGLTIHRINILLFTAIVFCVILCGVSAYFLLNFMFGFLSCLSTLLIAARLSTYLMECKINNLLRAKSPFVYEWNRLKLVKFGKVISMLLNRGSSLLHMSQFIFMKPIRQMRYNAVYADKGWRNRRITNTIYELTSRGSWKGKYEKSRIPDFLVPSETIQNNSQIATDMPTTLWFTDEDKRSHVPEAVFCCGQYNICMNLLEYIHKLKQNMENTTDTHKLVLQCEEQLMEDWKNFNENPQYLLNLVK